jgi:DUF1680 family protein
MKGDVMNVRVAWVMAGACVAGVCSFGADYPISPVPFTSVGFDGGALGARQQTNSTVTIPFCLKQCETSGRLKNFDLAAEVMRRRAAGEKDFEIQPPTTFPFDDTDIYKAIEAAAYDLQIHPNPERKEFIEQMITHVKAGQEPDGYIYTFRTMHPTPYKGAWYGAKRWERDPSGSHETYDLGHLYEAATAWAQATGSKSLLDIALKSANLLDHDLRNVDSPPGHQIVEMGLVKLYRQTGDERWLTLARHFLDSRKGGGGEYSQNHKPILQQDKAIGHAVRANYMYSGMTDIAALQNDAGYKSAVEKIWDNVVGTKWHLTGGCGWSPAGEAYGEDFVLPSNCYNETCAQVAFLFWTHRMFLLTGESKYMDAFERTLYNGALSGVSVSGDRFFYPNTLEHAGPAENKPGTTARSPWFGCACCPPNIMRFLASLGQYAYAKRGDTIYVNIYAASHADIGGFKLAQRTDYPWGGKVEIDIAGSGSRALALRVPCWAVGKPVPSDLYRFADDGSTKWTLAVNGKETVPEMKDGYAVITREWKPGDRVTVEFPMEARRVVANPNVKDLAGQVAFERGPVVFAFEAMDQKDKGNWRRWGVDKDAKPSAEYRPGLLGGCGVLTVGGFTGIPYALWNNREDVAMRVWLHDGPDTKPEVTASFCRPEMDLYRAFDGVAPRTDTEKVPNFDFWPHKGTEEWIAVSFAKPRACKTVRVVWFDDTGSGECRYPAAWELLWRGAADAKWTPVKATAKARDWVSFEPVEAQGLRLNVRQLKGFASGMYEVIVE